MRYCALGIAALLALGCLNQSTCSNRNFEHIDTTRIPVGPVVSRIAFTRSDYNQKIRAKTRAFYEANGYRIHWLQKRRPHPRYNAFVKALKASADYGIRPEDYRLNVLESAIGSFYNSRRHEPAEIAGLDMKITATFFLFTTHLLEGRISRAGAEEFIWKKERIPEDDVAMLAEQQSPSDLRKGLASLHPADPQYESLAKALGRYHALASADLPQIKSEKRIAPGDSNKAIALVRRRLSMEPDSGIRPVSDSLLYDADLVRAVSDFQERHGLPADGVIEKNTVRLLNVPFHELADIIELNLERLRWHPHVDPEGEYIIINIPEYMLRVMHGSKKMLEMKVILGSDFNATPIFHDTLKYIVFSPTWTVPKSIIEKEFLPVLQEDPGHYKSQGFAFYKEGVEIDPEKEKWKDKSVDVRSYQVVQKPGSGNALGDIKFVMPNNFNIYLHDTPAGRLFSREKRALSHGCIRLEQPTDLARYLLQDQREWDDQAIREAMGADQPKTVHLARAIPVHIVYRTAWVDHKDRVNFRPDIYGHDQRHLARLKDSGDVSMKE